MDITPQYPRLVPQLKFPTIRLKNIYFMKHKPYIYVGLATKIELSIARSEHNYEFYFLILERPALIFAKKNPRERKVHCVSENTKCTPDGGKFCL